MFDITAFVDELNTKFNGSLKLSEDGKSINAEKDDIKRLISVLRDEYSFNILVDITSADYESNFVVVYHLMKLSADMLRIKVSIPADKAEIDSLSGIWKAADVMEREIFDLMGIVFVAHENLKRILLPEEYEGYPLRKSFKLNIAKRFE
jgi:NADH:ubiquinone oxidoreductase subunit C